MCHAHFRENKITSFRTFACRLTVGQKKSRDTTSSRSTTRGESRWSSRSTSLQRSSRPRSASGPQGSRPAKCAPASLRAQSSLGFSRGTTASGATEGGRPIGFDIAQYVKRRGSAAGIRIGINGDPSRNDYFRNYVKECQVRVARDEDLAWSLESESDTETEDDTFSSAHDRPVHVQKAVPLCWEDQFRNTHETFVQQVKIERPPVETPGEHDCTPPEPASTSVQLSEKLKRMSNYLSVMLSYRDCCITSWRDLQEMSSRHHDVHVPSSQLLATETDDNLDHLLAKNDSEDKSVHDGLPTDADHEKLRTELLPKLSHTSADRMECLLCIWLKIPQDRDLNLELLRLEFDVFVTDTHHGQIRPSTKAFRKLKAKRISDSVYVFLLDVSCMSVPPPSPSQACSWAHPVQSTSTRNHKIRVSVVCCEPRVVLLCMEANTESVTLFTDNPATEGSVQIPQKFLRKRGSYCNQEEDEDMTDLRAIAKQFPDLRVLDFDGSSLESTPFSSPVHQSPHSPHGAPTRLVDSDRPPYRPGVYFQPSSATTNSSYADIVRQWLKPYLDH